MELDVIVEEAQVEVSEAGRTVVYIQTELEKAIDIITDKRGLRDFLRAFLEKSILAVQLGAPKLRSLREDYFSDVSGFFIKYGRKYMRNERKNSYEYKIGQTLGEIGVRVKNLV